MEYRCQAVFSRDDAGWYVEIFDPRTGDTIHMTDVCHTKTEAFTHAQLWLNGQAACKAKGSA